MVDRTSQLAASIASVVFHTFLIIGELGDAYAAFRGAFVMMDAVYLGVVVFFFALSWGLVKLAERL